MASGEIFTRYAQMLSTSQVADMLKQQTGITYSTQYIARLATNGSFPGAMRGSTRPQARWNIPVSGVQAFIDSIAPDDAQE